eukprot:Nitzschia sp. Nitz4//scaffold23_size168460//15883//17412//NITZ4_002202-RA/size168460-processed-gene-0.247-mRNA-1//-1//CDS//3329543584//600//frame0
MSTRSNKGTTKREDQPEAVPLLGSNQQERVPVQQQSYPPDGAAMMAQYGATNPPSFYPPPGYYPDPSSGGAAPPVGFNQGVPPPGYFYGGYAPQGYPMPPPSGAGGQPFYPPQAFAYPSPYSPAAPAPTSSQRPPRSQRRGSQSKSSPSPTNSGRKVAEEVGSNVRAPPLASSTNDTGRDRSSIPPLQDIFSDSQPLRPNSPTALGYGSTGSNPPSQTAQTPPIYNAPPRSSARGGKAPAPASGGESKPHPLKDSSDKAGASHRRINSDLPLRGNHHRRLSSSEALPPAGPTHRRVLSGSARARSFSAGQVVVKPTHRRANSTSSMQSMSSGVVSNIAKSDFFAGVDKKGRVQMHFPFEAIRLVMVDPKRPALKAGHLYFDGQANDYDQFEEYHRLTTAENGGIAPAPQWESLDRPANVCGCTCNNCNGCLGKKELLPPPQYIMPVNDNVYRHIVGEIADAHAMPCGLFFCGHHEDVAHPSILIAVFIVVVLFATLFYFAIRTGDMTVV